MAPWLKFMVSFAFVLSGMAILLIRVDAVGFAAFILLFVTGGALATWIFKRIASPEQIRMDLEARLHND